MLCQNRIQHRSLLLDSVLLCSLTQVPSSDALTTSFQTTYRTQDSSYQLTAKGEVTTDIDSSQTNFKIFNHLSSQVKIWDQPARLPFINEQSSCTQVKLPISGEPLVFALLIDNCLLSGISLNEALSELSENSIIWLDIPILKVSDSSERIIPIFRITKLSNTESQLTIKAQPLNCDQCPNRPKGNSFDNKCCGGCKESSKSMMSSAGLDILSREEFQDFNFEPVEINYLLSTNELNIVFNTTHGLFTTKLSHQPTEKSRTEYWQSLFMPSILLLSLATVVQSKTKE